MKLLMIFIVLLLSSLHSNEAEGIRLERATLSSSSKQEIVKILIKGSNQDQEMLGKKDKITTGTILRNRRLSSRVVTRNTYHWLPKIHEDYYGPRHHRPRHH